MSPEQLRALRPMSVSVQAGLDEGLRHRARAAWNQRVLQHAGEIVLGRGLEPGLFQGLRARIAIDERVERLARTGLVVVDERRSRMASTQNRSAISTWWSRSQSSRSADAAPFPRTASSKAAFACPLCATRSRSIASMRGQRSAQCTPWPEWSLPGSAPRRRIACSHIVAAGVSKTIDASTSEISHAEAASSASSWPGPQPA